MKTAMMELYEWYIEMNRQDYHIHKWIRELMEKEKQQIIDAFNEGDNDNGVIGLAERYYKYTYEEVQER